MTLSLSLLLVCQDITLWMMTIVFLSFKSQINESLKSIYTPIIYPSPPPTVSLIAISMDSPGKARIWMRGGDITLPITYGIFCKGTYLTIEYCV